jgi:hypothetical protein
MTATVFAFPSNRLIGTWHGEGDDARAEYTVSFIDGNFQVKGIDAVDGEVFVISDVRWDGAFLLRFRSQMPSTGRVVEHVFEALSSDSVKHTFTLTDTEIWTKKTT